jgi:hypothetical protein
LERPILLKIGTCSVCGTGCVGIRVSAKSGIVGMCDECDAVWLDKKLTDGPHFPEQPDLPSPGDGSSLRSHPAHWATLEEAAQAAWDSEIVDSGDALG